MKIQNYLGTLLCGLLLLACNSASADTVHYDHTFDGVANDSTPALQGFTNGASGATLPDLTTGLMSYSSSQAGGFNTPATIDLSAETEFTVEFVVENDSAEAIAGLNGSFFGIATSTGAGVTTGSALYNNVGATADPAIGLQVGDGRGGPDDTEYAVDAGAVSYTGLGNAFVDDATAGYTVSVTYADDMMGGTLVTIETTGLASDISSTNTAAFTYASIADNVTPNVSSQGGDIDLASIQVFTAMAVPEPSSLTLLGAGCLAFLGRRRRA